jgi:tellurite methyltransferase
MRMVAALILKEWFGDIDIYLFDQLLKERFTPSMVVLDAGCGEGRNLVYFLRSGYNVYGVDQSPVAIARVGALAVTLAPHLPVENFRVEPVESMSFADLSFDVVISSAVLHFATSEDHWQSMVEEMWRVLKSGGILFARLASTVGIEDRVEHLEGRRYHLPDGSNRFLVDEELLMTTTAALNGELIEPLKSVVVQNMRSMATWCLRKK